MPIEPDLPSPPFQDAVLLETHAHTAEVSGCSALPAGRLVKLVAEHGYGAVVITDHNIPGRTRTGKQCALFARGFALAKEAGQKYGVAVLPGMELRFKNEGYNDFLVFLPDAELYQLRDLPAMKLRDFKLLADELGMLIYQAHPYRPHQFPEPPMALHGVEVFNGNPHHDSRNHEARAYAEKHGLSMLSGSDLHEEYGAGRGGIWAPRKAIASPRAFVDYLRATPIPKMLMC